MNAPTSTISSRTLTLMAAAALTTTGALGAAVVGLPSDAGADLNEVTTTQTWQLPDEAPVTIDGGLFGDTDAEAYLIDGDRVDPPATEEDPFVDDWNPDGNGWDDCPGCGMG